LIKGYVISILEVLWPKVLTSSPGVIAMIVEAVGILCKIGGEDIAPHVEKYLPYISEMLTDHSVAKKEAALKALINITAWTGYVVTPYEKYPNLLSILLNMTKTEKSNSIRQLAVKLIGTLGALDPYRYKVGIMVIVYHLINKHNVHS
jgi:FKBP12-rapamycin complex-associated protein